LGTNHRDSVGGPPPVSISQIHIAEHHKVPCREFARHRLSLEEDLGQGLIADLHDYFPPRPAWDQVDFHVGRNWVESLKRGFRLAQAFFFNV
jgi:hypothetical protein